MKQGSLASFFLPPADPEPIDKLIQFEDNITAVSLHFELPEIEFPTEFEAPDFSSIEDVELECPSTDVTAPLHEEAPEIAHAETGPQLDISEPKQEVEALNSTATPTLTFAPIQIETATPVPTELEVEQDVPVIQQIKKQLCRHACKNKESCRHQCCKEHVTAVNTIETSKEEDIEKLVELEHVVISTAPVVRQALCKHRCKNKAACLHDCCKLHLEVDANTNQEAEAPTVQERGINKEETPEYLQKREESIELKRIAEEIARMNEETSNLLQDVEKERALLLDLTTCCTKEEEQLERIEAALQEERKLLQKLQQATKETISLTAEKKKLLATEESDLQAIHKECVENENRTLELQNQVNSEKQMMERKFQEHVEQISEQIANAAKFERNTHEEIEEERKVIGMLNLQLQKEEMALSRLIEQKEEEEEALAKLLQDMEREQEAEIELRQCMREIKSVTTKLKREQAKAKMAEKKELTKINKETKLLNNVREKILEKQREEAEKRRLQQVEQEEQERKREEEDLKRKEKESLEELNRIEKTEQKKRKREECEELIDMGKKTLRRREANRELKFELATVQEVAARLEVELQTPEVISLEKEQEMLSAALQEEKQQEKTRRKRAKEARQKQKAVEKKIRATARAARVAQIKAESENVAKALAQISDFGSDMETVAAKQKSKKLEGQDSKQQRLEEAYTKYLNSGSEEAKLTLEQFQVLIFDWVEK